MSAAWREPFARTRLRRADAEPSFRRALGLFVDAVRVWPAPLAGTAAHGALPTVADGVRCLAVLLAAAEAAAEGTRLAVRDIAIGTGQGDG